MKRTFHRYMRLAAAVCISLTLLPAGPLLAQATVPPTPDLDSRARKKVALSREAREVADEYADVLRELRSTLGDYREYLQESESETIIRYLSKMDRFTANLDKGIYITERDRLQDDLESQVDEVDEVETYIRDSKEIFPMKLYKIVQSLNRDLGSLQDLLDAEVIDQLDELEINEADLQAYLKDALRERELSERDRAAAEQRTQSSVSRREVREAEELAKAARKEAEKAASVKVKLPKVPTPPVPVVRVDPKTKAELRDYARNRAQVQVYEGEGSNREMSGVVAVTSPKLPVRITNRFGSVTVSGTPAKEVKANWSVEFHAESRQTEKEFLNGAQLRVSQEADGYDVYVELPDVGQSGSRILSSELTVTVPTTNPVVLENSFGEVTADNLHGGLDLTNSYGSVEVENIHGKTTITSSMGELSMTSVNGTMNIRNAYSPITMDACNGDFEMENAYSEIELSSCKGRGVIRNSGSVEVSNHTGNLEIRNSFGSVEVDGLAGDLDVENQFQPIVVRDIKGAVILENANSEIDVTNISGSLSANNTFGLISAEGADGPIKLVNKNGNIALILGARFKGNSLVRTSFGNVDVTVPPSANLLVKARTTFGDIRSFMPVKIDETGQSKTAALRLGRGADSLSIVAENSNIVINGK